MMNATTIVTDDPAVRDRWRTALPAGCPVSELGGGDLTGGGLPESSVVLMDRPEVTRVRALIDAQPRLRIIAFYGVFNVVEGVALFRAGVRAYCNRYIDPKRLRQVIDIVEAGEVWVGERMMNQLVLMQGHASRNAADSHPAWSQLTDREREVLDWVIKGVPNKAIAAGLGMSERTVKAHVSSILHKFGEPDRLQLVLHLGRYPAPI